MNDNNFDTPQNSEGSPKPLRSLSRVRNSSSPANEQPPQHSSPVWSDIPYQDIPPRSPAADFGAETQNEDQQVMMSGDMPASPMPHRKKRRKKKNRFLMILKKLFAVIATTLLSLFLVMIITGTIVTTALTVYVLEFMEGTTSITLQELESGSDTYFYSTDTDENGNEKLTVIHRVKTDVHRIPVSIDRIPQHVRDAFVYTEDERFYSHDGVDYKRTFSAFVNMFLHIYDTEQGGSTITQQLIKNLTGDDEHSPQRKIREIFSAMQLEKSYTKDEILEEYLNYIGFGGAVNGIQLASLTYFGKNVEELTTPEAAVLAAIPKSPEEYGPFTDYVNKYGERVSGRDVNRERQKYVLKKLYDNGAITYDQYQEFRSTPIIYADSDEYK
ncbi:MAG: transglycosylase domain-containing protein, partial [Ruminococcus sp.]|nr:transglycosylase domain-containing protein [Ruminococcus sp.]